MSVLETTRTKEFLPRGNGKLVRRKSSGESQTRAAGDARTRVAGALASFAGAPEERVGPRGSRRAQSNLAIRHDQSVGGPDGGLGPRVRDRLLHARDRGLESLRFLFHGYLALQRSWTT
jgi:hypothetical protein